MLNHLRRLTSVAPALLLLAGCGSGNEFTPLSATGRSTSTSNPGSSSSSSSSGSSSSSSSSSGGSATDQTFLFATTGLAAGQNFVWNLSYNNSVVASSSVNSNGTSSILAPPVTGTENFEFTVTQQPTGQTCTVTNNSGSVSSSLVPPAVTFTCTDGSSSPAAVAHVLATPGQRAGASSWVERSGSLVQFGGESQGIDGAAHAENDLWRYLPSTRTWTRIAATTAPAARSFAASWLDARGEVWIFGGRRPTADGVQFYDDLWEFTPGTLTWTCRSGCAGEDASSTGLPRPEARMGATTWVDADGDLWLAGGRGAYGSSDLMDVWRFTPRTQSWTQVR